MSGIYIKGMEMPKSCGECKFFAWKRVVGNHCTIDDKITFHATLDGLDVSYERNGKCPLIPVPEQQCITKSGNSYFITGGKLICPSPL